MLPTGHPADEPANGDFVAYLAQIEARQMRAIRSNSPSLGAAVDDSRQGTAAPEVPLNRDQAKAVLESLKLQATQGVKANPRFMNALIPAIVGLVFLFSGLVGDAGIFGIGIGFFLFWIASRQWREAMREGSGKSPGGSAGSTRT
jgi:hypothetical protein